MIYIIGIGPTKEDITVRALNAIKKADTIIGYKKYIETIEDLVKDKTVIEKGMGDELDRIELAIEIHLEGHNVAVVSSGDPNVYGMSNVFFQLIGKYSGLEYEIIPGITAANYAASLLGAPLHDFAIISLSNVLTPLSEILDKVKYAALGDLVIAFYNPISKTRKTPYREAMKLLLENRDPSTPVGIVRSSTDPPTVTVTMLNELNEDDIDMSSMLIVGNSTTYIEKGNMITSRGYVVKKEIHELARKFYHNYFSNNYVDGPNLNCEYYPCHYESQNCAFCYCPFYPCCDGSTNGRWIEDKAVWNCQDCKWIHHDDTVEYLNKHLKNVIKEVDDLKKNKKELLKLRREVMHHTMK